MPSGISLFDAANLGITIAAVGLAAWLFVRLLFRWATRGRPPFMHIVASTILLAIGMFAVAHTIIEGMVYNRAAVGTITVDRQTKPESKVLLFVHGWTGSSGSWSTMLDLIRKDPRLDAFELATFDFSTGMRRKGSTVPVLSAQLFDEIEHRYKGRDVLIVAHSLGGVLVRNMLLQGPLWSDRKQVRGLVTFGSPFDGAKPATLVTEGGVSTSLIQDLSAASTLLSNMKLTWLQAKARRVEIGFLHFCVASDGDAVVEMSSALMDCDVQRTITQWGHVEMIKPVDIYDRRYVLAVEGINEIKMAGWREPSEPQISK